jgi:phosphoribosyl 1,2-cyclic phosphodiesterase
MAQDTFRVLVLGTGWAFSDSNYTVGFAVQTGTIWTLIEAPFPPRKVLKEACAGHDLKLDLQDISATIITHLHADHCSGVPIIGLYNKFEVGHPAHIAGGPEIMQRIWPDFLAAGLDVILDNDLGRIRLATFEDYFTSQVLQPGQSNKLVNYEVEICRTKHMVPTYAVKITFAGRSLAYSSDTPFDKNVIDFVSSADCIFHEVGDYPHAGLDQLKTLDAEIQEKMYLTHRPDSYDTGASPIKCLAQGQIIEIP